MKNKFYKLDKAVSKQVMAEMKGKIFEHICPYCKGERYYECYNQDGSCTHIPCEDCNGAGTIKIEY